MSCSNQGMVMPQNSECCVTALSEPLRGMGNDIHNMLGNLTECMNDIIQGMGVNFPIAPVSNIVNGNPAPMSLDEMERYTRSHLRDILDKAQAIRDKI